MVNLFLLKFTIATYQSLGTFSNMLFHLLKLVALYVLHGLILLLRLILLLVSLNILLLLLV